jgi:hypothetical protein
MGQSRLLHWPRTNARQIGLRASSCENGHGRTCFFDANKDEDDKDTADVAAVCAAHSPRRNQCGHGGLTRRSNVSAPERELGVGASERVADAGRATPLATDDGVEGDVDLGAADDDGIRRQVSARAVRECDANRNGAIVDDVDDDDDEDDEEVEAAG